MRTLIASSVAGLRSWQLWLLQFIGNAALFAAAAGWLLIPEEHVWQLMTSALLAIVVIFFFLWLHAGTLTFFVPKQEDAQSSAFRAVLKHLLPFLVWALIFGAVLWAIDHWTGNPWQLAGYLESKAPSWIREHAYQYSIKLVQFFFFVIFWYLAPGLFLPFGVASAHGLRRENFLAALRTLKRLSYWILLALFVAIGIYAPQLILNWAPESSLTKEFVSVALRMTFAYALAVACWLMTAALLAAAPRSPEVEPPPAKTPA